MMVTRTLFIAGFVRQWHPHRCIASALLGIALGAGVVAAPTGAFAAPRETAALAPSLTSPAARPVASPVDLPAILSPADIAAYQRLDAAQRAGDWALADRLIGELHNPVLLGHVLADRYLERGDKPAYGALVSWLKSYGDHPEAGRIHALALKLKPAHAPAPPAPAAAAMLAGSGVDDGNVRDLTARAHPAATPKAKTGKTGSGAVAAPGPQGAWLAGLQAWRQGQHGQAIKYFEQVATASSSSNASAAAAAYWAARGYLVTRQPQNYTSWMTRAAESPYSFYGMLARRALGQDINIDWELPALTPAALARLKSHPGAARAIALIQLGDRARAEDELRRLFAQLPGDLQPYALTTAEHGGMPGLAMRMAGRLLQTSGVRYDAGLYPVPPWSPPGGFKLDRALLFAIARTESGLNPAARNPSGAAGLMQLMPGTARVMSKGKPGGDSAILDPHANLGLGQRYVGLLLSHEKVKGNLLSLIAAYNVGPGNVVRPDHADDPLLFLETLPANETRSLVQRVLTSYWIYQLRLGQPIDSLDAVAQGIMPVYTGSPAGETALAERNGRN